MLGDISQDLLMTDVASDHAGRVGPDHGIGWILTSIHHLRSRDCVDLLLGRGLRRRLRWHLRKGLWLSQNFSAVSSGRRSSGRWRYILTLRHSGHRLSLTDKRLFFAVHSPFVISY